MALYWPVVMYTWRPLKPAQTHPFERIEQRSRRPRYARGRVFKRGGTWHYEVIVRGRVVHADNTDHWRTMFDDCFESAAAFDHVLSTGHRLKDKTWAAVVDRSKS